LLDYNSESWIKNYALKEYVFFVNNDSQKMYKLSTRIPGIILNYISEKMLEENRKAPFLIPISIMPDEGGSERTTSPRTWTLIADNMILDGVKMFESLKNSEIELYENKSIELFGNKEKAFDLFMKNPDNQITLLAKQTPEFGIDGEKIIQEIVSKFIYSYSNRITPQEVILNYENSREKVRKLKERTGAILNLVIGIATEISLMSEEDFNEKDVKKIAVRINTFFEDMSVPSEDLTAFIYILNKNGKESSIVKDLVKILNGISPRFKTANSDFYFIGKDEIKIK
jgi:hypothetical protein